MNTFPDFTTVPFHAVPADASTEQWRARFESETVIKSLDECVQRTLEGIDVRPLYTAADLKDCEYLNSMPGFAPYVRGPYGSMFVTKPWTVRQYAGFSTAEESNAFYRRNIAAGSRVCRSLLTCPPIAVTTPTTRAPSPTSAKRAWRWTRLRT